MNHLSFDIATLTEGYQSGSFSVSQVVRVLLRRIGSGDSRIWISVDTEERLLQQAFYLENQDPKSLPLYGIPFAVKDNIDVDGLPTTAACPDFRYFANKDATVVANLRQAGAIPVGKTNLDQFATGLVGVRSPYGTPTNPFNPEYLPGGSSSGSAVSVALGQISFALGTDTAGSGRVPACFNNLIGLKPTRGLLSNTGVVPACRSIDCVSIFALNAGDAQSVLRIAASYDPTDPFSRRAADELPSPRNVFREGMSFGVPLPHQLQFFGNADYQDLYLKSLDKLESLGFTRKVVDFAPLFAAARLLYEGPWVAERYAAIRDLMEHAPEALHPTTRAIIEKGIEPTAVDAFEARYKLEAYRQQASAILAEVDFMAAPTAGTHHTVAEVEADPIQSNSDLGYYTNFMNLLDLSAVATPTAFTSKKLPFGITLFAPAFHDEKLLAIADRLHQASDLTLGATATRRFPPLKQAEFHSLPIAVCGAHMRGLPLNCQLTELGAVFSRSARTSPAYRLFSLPGTSPPKPGLIRDPGQGSTIEVEIWNLPTTQWAAFLEQIPPPLAIANIELEDGSYTKGFSCEAWGVENAIDITGFGGWRSYLRTLDQSTP